MTTFSKTEIEAELTKIDNWTSTKEGIKKNFVFDNFTKSLAFIVEVGFLSEKQNHHPKIINEYNKVQLILFTHDDNAITHKDFKLAKAIDGLANNL